MVDNKHKEHINDILNRIETEKNVTILYAVESGSRAWGFHSNDSDYDIRFVYIHNDVKWYLRINKKPTDTIAGFSEDRVYDWDGWDIRKAIQHTKESNPSIIEWMYSPIIYRDNEIFSSGLRNIISNMHTNISLCYHYRNMAISNWNARIEGKEIVNTKKYMYIIRPIGMLHWLMVYPDKPLVINYYQILKELESHMNPEVLSKIYELLEYKKNIKELGENPRIKEIDIYIQEIIQKFNEHNNKKPEEINVQNIAHVYSNIQNQFKKVMSVLNTQGYVNRSEYLIIIGHALQFVWLQQHSDKNRSHIPERIGELLKTVDIPADVRDIIKKIIIKDELEKTVQLTDAKSTNITEIKKVPETERIIPAQKWIQMFNDIIKSYYEIIQEPVSLDESILKSLDATKTDLDDSKLMREDLIEFWIKKQIPELLWLLENPEQSMSRIPKQIHMNVKAIDETIHAKINKLIDEGKTKYYLLYPELNKWIEELIITNKDFIEQVKQNSQNQKETNVHKNYQHSIKKLDPEEFNNFFFKCLDIIS